MTTANGKKLNWQSRQMIFNLHNYFKDRKRDKSTVEYEEDVNINCITAAAAGVSWRTVRRVVVEGLSLTSVDGTALFATADKRKRTIPKKRIPMDCFIEGLIRRRVLKACAESDIPVSLNLIHKIVHEEDIIKSSNEYLRNLLIKMGFTHMTKKRILYENDDIASHRWKFLNDIKKYREEKRHIVYVDETFFNLDQSKFCYWETDEDNLGVFTQSGKGQGYIVIQAGGKDGFIKNAFHLIKTLNVRECEMNSAVFSNWVKEKLLPNLPEKSIVVMDNAEYHFSKQNPQEIEKLLLDNGHELARMPLSHLDLNPLELIWRGMKQNQYLGKNTFCSLVDLQRSLEKLFKTYPQQKWDSSIEYVKKVESEYFVFNGAFEDIDEMLVEEEETDGGRNTDDDDDSVVEILTIDDDD